MKISTKGTFRKKSYIYIKYKLIIGHWKKTNASIANTTKILLSYLFYKRKKGFYNIP